MGLWGQACEWPKAGPVFLLAEVLETPPHGESGTLLRPCSRGLGAVALALGSSSRPCATCGHSRPVWGITFSRLPGGYRLFSLAAWVSCNLPGVLASVLEQQSRAGFWGLEAWGRRRFTEVRRWGCSWSVDSRQVCGRASLAALRARWPCRP